MNDQMDHTMSGDDTMNTITASTVQQLPEVHRNNSNSYGNGQQQYDSRPQTSYSDTGFSRPYNSHTTEQQQQYGADTPPLYSNGSQPQPVSLPTRSRSGSVRKESQTGSQSEAYQNQYPQQRSTQPSPEPQKSNTSVVIKVGMVGDAQIGKTSLMVKYVEGSWDEDYIQTLGMHGQNTSRLK